jgi:hypothetical protein
MGQCFWGSIELGSHVVAANPSPLLSIPHTSVQHWLCAVPAQVHEAWGGWGGGGPVAYVNPVTAAFHAL